jgi:type I restriction enzyme S subunit
MSRGRKPAKVSLGSDWKEIFRSSVGYYLQSIIVELASRSISENGFDSNAKLKPKTSLPEIEESEKPFEIPKNWNWYRLGELCNYGSSSKAEPKNLNDSTWVLDLEDIEKETSVLLAKMRFAERNSLSTKSIFKKGDVLYSKLRPYLDKVIVADEDGVCTTEILPLSFSEEINPTFLLLTLKLRSFLNYVNSVTKGMKMPRLGTKEGKMALIPLPSLSEQNKILNFLTDLENNSLKTDGFYFDKEVEQKIVNLQHSQLQGSQISTELYHQLALVKDLRQVYLREAMQGKLVSQDSTDEPAEILLEKIKTEKEKFAKRDKPLPSINTEEIPFEIPSNWAWCRLGEIVETTQGVQISKDFQFAQQKIGFRRYLYISDFEHNNDLKYVEDKYPSKIVKKEDLIVVNTGATSGKIFRGIDGILSNNLFKVSIPKDFLNSNYLYFFVTSKVFKDFQRQLVKGAANPHMGHKNFNSTLFPLPPLAEQERIVAKLEKLMKFCDELEANIRQGIKNADQLLQTALKEALEPKENGVTK